MKKLLFALGFTTLCSLGIFLIYWTRPEAVVRPPAKPRALKVEVMEIKPQDFQVILETNGTVEPKNETRIVSQVEGEIILVSPKLTEGAFFEKGEPLFYVDDRNYQVALAKAQANRDQMRLNNSTQSQLVAAEKELEQAQLNLERTVIRAPYRSIIRSVDTNLGEYINKGTRVAEVFSIDDAIIKLPLSSDQLRHVTLPDYFGNAVTPQTAATYPLVTVKSTVAGKEYSWKGSVITSKGEFDSATKQLFVVAKIPDPYLSNETGKPPLRMGQFVTVEVQGKMYRDAVVIPQDAVIRGESVYIVENNALMNKQVSVLWSDSENAIIESGLEPGMKLIISRIGTAVSGTPVEIPGEATKGEKKPGAKLNRDIREKADGGTEQKESKKNPESVN